MQFGPPQQATDEFLVSAGYPGWGAHEPLPQRIFADGDQDLADCSLDPRQVNAGLSHSPARDPFVRLEVHAPS